MSVAKASLHKRLLLDIAELQSKPYPNISLHIHDSDLTTACLTLNADGYGPLHLTVTFMGDYPLSPPTIRMDSAIRHPNIFGSYICSSILNTTEGYTSAYTLKGIAIQLLSFFSSDKVEQEGGGYSVNLDSYKNQMDHVYRPPFACKKCDFAGSICKARFELPVTRASSSASSGRTYVSLQDGNDSETHWPRLENLALVRLNHVNGKRRKRSHGGSNFSAPSTLASTRSIHDIGLPDEIVLLICDNLDTEELLVFASAWDRIGALMTDYDLIRTRELQCFCLKTSYINCKLGVGVSVGDGARKGSVESEFDLISETAFHMHSIRRSVQGVPFSHWLPLPISNPHWRRIKGDVPSALENIRIAARLPIGEPVSVIYDFMNSVVVKLNQQADAVSAYSSSYEPTPPTSSLTHASEKAIESYFHLFHLLLCLATSTTNSPIISAANHTLLAFSNGRTSKRDCPNLGHVLIASLISSVPMSERVVKSLIRETITRNVVWMLDSRGANMPELAYLEPSAISEYRLQKTFEASKTSYRLLMFLRLFQRVAVESRDGTRKSLDVLRDEAFLRHGAPPKGSAKFLADSIRRIHQVNSFPQFLTAMGVQSVPSKEWFTAFLRECVTDSEKKGYSRAALSQGEALWLRRQHEEGVKGRKDVSPVMLVGGMRGKSFFPGRGGAVGGGAQRGGRGQWRGQGRRY